MNPFQRIKGGICAPLGFLAGATGCGIKTGKILRDDLGIIISEFPCTAAATFTTNKVKAAPVLLSMEHLKKGGTCAVILNSGNANACTGKPGMTVARRMAKAMAAGFSIKPEQVLVCSTGRIGVPLAVDRIEKGLPKISVNRKGSLAVAKSIMTSDTFAKEFALKVQTPAGSFHIGGIAKGAGMIDPNMATMLCVVTTDAMIPTAALRKATSAAVENSFNRITVDGDMSTNDTVIVLANGESGAKPPVEIFQDALDAVMLVLARMIVEDGEGVSKFVEVEVIGAASRRDARLAAEAIANSTLVKCAWAGSDPNWGRIMDAVGYCGAKMTEEKTDIYYNDVCAVRRGLAVRPAIPKLKKIAAKKAFSVTVDMKMGSSSHMVLTTDLTEEYVRLNLGE